MDAYIIGGCTLKHGMVLAPQSMIDKLCEDLHTEAEETQDWETYYDIMNRLRDGERVYLDENCHMYLQRIFSLHECAMKVGRRHSENDAEKQEIS